MNIDVLDFSNITRKVNIAVSDAAALSVGPNGNTNPILRVVSNVASQATGLSITGNAAGSGVELGALSTATDEAIILQTKGSAGSVYIKNTATATFRLLPAGNDIYIQNTTSGNIQFTGLGGAGLNGNVHFVANKVSMGNGTGVPFYVLHIAPNSGVPAGQTVFVRDATSSTGKTGIVVQEGPGQSTISLFNLLDTAGANGVGFTRNAAGVLEINNGTAGTFRDLKLRRLDGGGGTAIATTDVALSGGWGASATVSAVSGDDTRGKITVQTNALDTPTLNPTLTLTFKDGTFTTAPYALTSMNNASTGVMGAASCDTTATTLVITYDGTPTALTAATYIFNYHVIK